MVILHCMYCISVIILADTILPCVLSVFVFIKRNCVKSKCLFNFFFIFPACCFDSVLPFRKCERRLKWQPRECAHAHGLVVRMCAWIRSCPKKVVICIPRHKRPGVVREKIAFQKFVNSKSGQVPLIYSPTPTDGLTVLFGCFLTVSGLKFSNLHVKNERATI